MTKDESIKNKHLMIIKATISRLEGLNYSIKDYFSYIKPKINNESIFRLLSPLLQIFFGIPTSKKFKTKIHKQIKNQEIEKLELLFLHFVNQQKRLIFN